MFLYKPVARNLYSMKVVILFYIFFIAATSLFCFLNIIKLDKVSEIQENYYFQENLKSSRYSIEAEILNVKGVLDQLSNARCVEEALALSETKSHILDEEAYAIYDTVTELRNVKNVSNSIEHMGIFFKQGNIVVDNRGAYDASTYYNSTYRLDNIESNRWYGLTDHFYNFYIMPSHTVSLNGRGTEGFTFIKTIPSNDVNSKGVIFALIKKSYLDTFVNLLDIDLHTSCVILDDANQIITSSRNYKGTALPEYSQVGSQASIYSKDGATLFMGAQIKNLPWKLILVRSTKPANLFSYAGANITLAFVSILAIGIFLSVLLQKYYSGSLNAIIQSITPGTSDRTGFFPSQLNFKRIYMLFDDRFKTLTNDIKNLNASINQYKGRIKSHALLSAVSPLQEFNLSLEVQNELFKDCQAFVIFYDAFSIKGTGNEAKGYFSFINFLQKNNIVFHAMEHFDSCKVILVFLNNTQLPDYDEILRKISTCKDEQEAKHGLLIHMLKGPLCSSMDSLLLSCKALNCDFKKLKYSGAYFNTGHAEISQNPDTNGLLSLSKEKLIVRCLKSGADDEIEGIIKALTESNFNGKTAISLFESQVLFYELLSVAIKYIEEEKENLNISHPDYALIKNYTDIAALLKQLCLVRKSKEQKENKAAPMAGQKNEILKFINDNYLDRNLSLKLVNDKFGISPSLITKTVKELSGDNFLDYVNKKRIKYAKKLLSSPGVTITRARDLSGFNDDSVFIKVFKKYEGKTPGEYKKEVRK